MTVRVYAITSNRRVPDVTETRLRAVGTDGVWAVVAPARTTPDATPTALRRYHRIVAAIAGQSTATLPARFGTVLEEGELSSVLRSRAKSLKAALRHVRGQTQMTIRVLNIHRDTESLDVSAVAARQSSGRAYLKGRANAAARARRVPGFEPVRQAVARWIRDERVEWAASVASVYHLVPRRSAVAYRRAATAAARRAGLRVVISGPFPPYAFTSS